MRTGQQNSSLTFPVYAGAQSFCLWGQKIKLSSFKWVFFTLTKATAGEL